MAHLLHPDAAAILSRLTQEGVNALYHFTSVENLPSICQIQAFPRDAQRDYSKRAEK